MATAGSPVSWIRIAGGDGCSLSPVTFLTKICIVSTASGEAERDIEDGECILYYFGG